ncbi:MAG: LysR family transcriptional regulator [Sphingomonadales bacterium]|nr:LysR family transcriptional regulator [Sphingomonadales bacterium]
MDRFAALKAFVAVAEQASFAEAARRTGVSPSVITRTIAALEGHLGSALFQRSTRRVTLTPAGTLLLDRARAILTQLDDAERAVAGDRSEPAGDLAITAPVMFGRLRVVPVVAELLQRHAALAIRLLLVDRNVRLVEEGIDVAVRVGPLADSALIATRIGEVRQAIVASPAYCARMGTPQAPADLARHHAILGDNVRVSHTWRFGPTAARKVAVTPRLTVNSLDAALAAARAGTGIANMLSYQVRDALADGSLVELLPDHAPPPLPVHLVFPANRAWLPSVRAFIAAMRAQAADTAG